MVYHLTTRNAIFTIGRVKVKKLLGTVTTDYLDGFQYENGALKFFPTAEGYYNAETGKYVYNYTDHLGNTRLSYFKNGAGAEIIEESNYCNRSGFFNGNGYNKGFPFYGEHTYSGTNIYRGYFHQFTNQKLKKD